MSKQKQTSDANKAIKNTAKVHLDINHGRLDAEVVINGVGVKFLREMDADAEVKMNKVVESLMTLVPTPSYPTPDEPEVWRDQESTNDTVTPTVSPMAGVV